MKVLVECPFLFTAMKFTITAEGLVVITEIVVCKFTIITVQTSPCDRGNFGPLFKLVNLFNSFTFRTNNLSCVYISIVLNNQYGLGMRACDWDRKETIHHQYFQFVRNCGLQILGIQSTSQVRALVVSLIGICGFCRCLESNNWKDKKEVF